MKKKEIGEEQRQARKKRRRRVGLVILGLLAVSAIVFHKHIYDYTRTGIGYFGMKDTDRSLEYREVTLTKEQMLEDMDYLYGAAVETALSREYAEKYYDVDYAEIYDTFKQRVLNCKDEFEFTALMIALDAKLPGGHSVMKAPSDKLTSAFPMGELADKETKIVNYSLCRQFEDRMGEYDQKGVVAQYMDGDYVLTEYAFCNFETIDGLHASRLLTLNGKPVKDVIKEIDTLNHWKYDESEETVFVPEVYFNDGIGEKYDAEIEFEDGRVIHKDLYVSPEYNMVYYYRSRLYPERYKKETSADSTAAESGDTRSYTITVDADRKLLYARFTVCNSEETRQVRKDLTEALTSNDIENVILDIRNNSGGEYNFVTDGVLPAVLDHDAGHINGELIPDNGYSKDFYDNQFYIDMQKIKKSGDMYHAQEDFRIKGEASKHYNIYTLVNHRTFSSGDIFAYLAKQDGIPLIGQNTGGDGLTGNPTQSYLPNSRLQFTFVCGNSEIFPEDGYAGVSPDYFVKDDWRTFLKRRELSAADENMDIGSYENRQKWDPYLLKALELIDNK